MRLLLLYSLLGWAAAAQQLRVTSADTKSIKLEWSGSAPQWTIERKSGSNPFEKVGTAPAGTYSDTKIDPYGTYRYRVSAPGAKVSNEVVAGPPPAGVLVAAPAPKAGEPGNYGTNSAMSRDENGDPAILFLSQDPNGDGNMADSEVYFVRWDRAAYAWTKPVKVATVGDLPSKNVEPLSLSCDARTGLLAGAFPMAAAGVHLAISRDRGVTWKLVSVQPAEAAVASTAVALDGNVVHLAWPREGPGVEYRTGSIDEEPSK